MGNRAARTDLEPAPVPENIICSKVVQNQYQLLPAHPRGCAVTPALIRQCERAHVGSHALEVVWNM
jgi:hypothetical protein